MQIEENINIEKELEPEEFLNFTKRDINRFQSTAKNCSNFNNGKDNIHLSPCYFCNICRKEFCHNCMANHLVNNINDRKHTLKCFTSKENNKINNKSILNDVKQNNQYIFNIYDKNKKEIEEDENQLLSFKHKINKKISELELYYKNKLYYIDNYYKNEAIENESIEREVLTNQLPVKKNNDFDHPLNSLKKLKKIKNMLDEKKFFFIQDFTEIQKDKLKQKNEYINQMLLSFNKFQNGNNNDINNNQNDKLLNFKRKRKIEENKESFLEEDIEKVFKNLNLNSSNNNSCNNKNNNNNNSNCKC